jgi:hypothetical protein
MLKFLVLESGYSRWYHSKIMDAAGEVSQLINDPSIWTGEAIQVDMNSDSNKRWWSKGAPKELTRIGFPLTMVMQGDIDTGEVKIIIAKRGYLKYEELKAIAIAAIERKFSDWDGTGKVEPIYYGGDDDGGAGIINPLFWLLGAAASTVMAVRNKGAKRIGYGFSAVYMGYEFYSKIPKKINE